MTTLRYRADLDGLRALAIVPVVWFHAGLPGMEGGFAGVDVFFVISGYLITQLIVTDLARDNFSFAAFYQARIRRIAPALIAMESILLVASAALLLPFDFQQFGASLLPSTTMIGNFYWRTHTNYFSPNSNTIPLIHLWTLGVEAQFYGLFPVLLLIATRFKCERLTVVTLALVSFGTCVIGTTLAPSAAFYLLPTRAWELMFGALVALSPRTPSYRISVLLSVSGLGLLGAAMIFLHAGITFPGWHAAIPAGGAMFLIAAGPDSPSGKLLSRPWLVWIGRRSYSLYLWHWPIFVLLRYCLAAGTMPIGWTLAGVASSCLAASASYAWIERPTRNPKLPFHRLATLLLAAGMLIVIAGFAIDGGDGFPARFSPEIDKIAAERTDLAPLALDCVNIPIPRIAARCHLGPAGSTSFFLWGDSHAAAISESVALGWGMSGAVASMNTCPPTLGWASATTSSPDQQSCRSRNLTLARIAIANPAIRTIFLVAYWHFYERNDAPGLWPAVQSLVDRLRAAGKRVVIIGGVPDPAVDVPRADAMRALFRRPMLKWICARFSTPIHHAERVDLSADFCAVGDRTTLFTDSNHPSRTAGLSIIRPAISNLAGAEAR